MIALTASIAIAWLLGYLVLVLVWPWRRRSPRHLALQLFLSFALGVGITSVHLFLWLTFIGGFQRLIWSEIAIVLALAGILFTSRQRRYERTIDGMLVTERPPFSLEWVVAGAFVLVLASTFVMFLLFVAREPHGMWDAVSMWNGKARIIFRTGGDWTAAGSAYISHPDYPLLLPLSIARGWSNTGIDSTIVPAVLAMLFTFGTIGLLVSSLTTMRSRTQGMLAGLALVAPPMFLRLSAWEYADLPLAFFILCTLVLFCLHDYAPAENRSLLVLAGLTAGFAAWTKNEGLLFVFVVMVGRTIVLWLRASRKQWARELLWFLAGLLPLLLIIAYYESRVATQNDIIAGQSVDSVIQRLTDLSRYKVIAGALLQELKFFGGLELNPTFLFALYPLILGVGVADSKKSGTLTSAVVLGLLFAGYLVVYLLTPRILSWHLDTSLFRLLAQLWPGMVFLYFLVVCTPEEALESAPVKSERAQVPAYHS